MQKNYVLYYGTIKLIKDLLSLGGWANEIIDIYNAGKLIETLPDPENNTKEEFLKTIACPLTERQIATVTKALKFHAEKGIILPSVFVVQAIERFGLVEQ